MCAITFRNLGFYYRADSDFKIRIDGYVIRVGGVVAIFGNSGSGKTTLARLIAGLEKPQTGEIILSGGMEDVVYVPQFPERIFIGGNVKRTVDIVLSGRENFHESFSFFKILLNRFGLDYSVVENRFGFELSSGELRKFAFCLGIACNPGLLILDEPSVGLDRESKRRLGEILEELRERKIIIVSHDRKFLEQVSRDIYLMEGGQIIGRMNLQSRDNIVLGTGRDEEKN